MEKQVLGITYDSHSKNSPTNIKHCHLWPHPDKLLGRLWTKTKVFIKRYLLIISESSTTDQYIWITTPETKDGAGGGIRLFFFFPNQNFFGSSFELFLKEVNS